MPAVSSYRIEKPGAKLKAPSMASPPAWTCVSRQAAPAANGCRARPLPRPAKSL